MVAARNSKKYEEFNRDRFINYEGEYIISRDSDIEIWSKEPIWDEVVGAFNNEDFNDGINLLTCCSVEEFEKKYGKKLVYGEIVPISGIIYD